MGQEITYARLFPLSEAVSTHMSKSSNAIDWTCPSRLVRKKETACPEHFTAG